jgi:predicted phosphodiesterase
VVQLIERQRPDFVVISGDLTQRAKPEQFRQARAFVDRIEALGVPTLAVPGNHDVPLYRVWERIFNPYGCYKKYFSPELEPVYRDEELLVVEKVLRATPDEVLKVVVAHHHLIPPPNFGTQEVLANAYEAIDLFSSAGVDLILSGHLHQAYIGSSEEFYPKGRPPVVILHSGTTTSNRGRAGEREANTCNWIEADGKSIVVSHYRWHPSLGRFAEHSRHWYPRQELVPYTLEGLEAPGRRKSRSPPVPPPRRRLRYDPFLSLGGS